MALFQVKLKSKNDVATDTMSFSFTKPAGFTFKAGQFADYTELNPTETDKRGNIRGFSFASAPYEEDIMFATRMRDSAFKRILRMMEIGTEVTLDASYGSFALHNNTKVPAVFLTGGIGIAPVRSMILQATHDKTEHKIFLFDANKTPKEATFSDDFLEAEKQNPNFTYIPSMTKLSASDNEWKGETGFFTKEMLQKYIGDLSQPIYYVCGPADMVNSVRKTLNESGVDDDNIRTEQFNGY